MNSNPLLSPRPAVQIGTAMGDLVLAALLGVLLQSAGGLWLPALPPALVWAAVSTLRVIRARVEEEHASIALYRMLGGSDWLLAGRAAGEALLLFAPAALASLVAAAWLLPAGGVLPLVLAPLAGAALMAALYAARLACGVAPAYEPDVAGQASFAQGGGLALLHKLYGYMPPLPARPAAYLGSQLRMLRTTFFLVISALVLGKQGHAEAPSDEEQHTDMAALDGHHQHADAADGDVLAVPSLVSSHRETVPAAALRLVSDEDHLALRKLAGLQSPGDLVLDVARLGGRELLALSGAPWLQHHVGEVHADPAPLPAPAVGALPVHAAAALLIGEAVPAAAQHAQLTLSAAQPLTGNPVAVLPVLLSGPMTQSPPLGTGETLNIGNLTEMHQTTITLVGTVTTIPVHTSDLGKA